MVIVAFHGRQRLEGAQRVGRPPLKRPERFGHTGLSLDLANRRRLALLGRLLLQPASQIGERPFRPRVGQGIDGGAESRLELVAALGDVCVPLASRASDARRSSKVPESAPPGVSPDGATSGTSRPILTSFPFSGSPTWSRNSDPPTLIASSLTTTAVTVAAPIHAATTVPVDATSTLTALIVGGEGGEGPAPMHLRRRP